MDANQPTYSFNATSAIKIIGRGAHGARALTRQDTAELFGALLDGQIAPVQVGALILAWRVKGESKEELMGMLDAMNARCPVLAWPEVSARSVILPCYNGSRRLPNLTPLLAGLLAKNGIPVVLHGVESSAGRVTTFEILEQLQAYWSSILPIELHPRFFSIQTFYPQLSALLDLRESLGVRNAAHTVVKMLQPFGSHRADEAVRWINYTHPDVRDTLTDVLLEQGGRAVLARGTEGEPVVDMRRMPEVRVFNPELQCYSGDEGSLNNIPALPLADAKSTAAWIIEKIEKPETIPSPILRQVEILSRLSY
jgi:anthranilate phosphoribosyltransferase